MVNRVVSSAGVWNPWRELARLQNEMGRIFNEPLRPGSFTDGPAFNVWKSEDKLIAVAEIPGLSVTDLDVSIKGDVVTVSGQRVSDEYPDSSRLQRRERATGKFTRVMKLPYRVDANRSEATYQNGVLTITLPATDEEKLQQITIKSAS